MICDYLGIPLILKPPKGKYYHGWGQECLDPKLVVSKWEITVNDCNDHPATFSFDLVHGSSPLVVGLDVGQHADTINNSDHPHISINDSNGRINTFHTYIRPDDANNPDCIRQRINIFPHQKRITSLLTNLSHLAAKYPNAFTKRIHRYTHVHPEQLQNLCDGAGILDEPLKNAIDRVDGECETCVRNGRPLPSKKISLTHVNTSFNQEVQADFTFFTANESGNPNIPKGTRYTIIVFTDKGTKYLQVLFPWKLIMSTDALLTKSYARTTAFGYVSMELHRASQLSQLRSSVSSSSSSDDEYNKRRLRDFLTCHDIQLRPRPTRRHNKTGMVERQRGGLEDILRRLVMERCQDDFETILARATLLANVFAGSDILSAFELARGYLPSILGMPQSTVPRELLDAHTQQIATRALQRVLRSRTPNIPSPGMFKPQDMVWVCYASSKNNEPNEWVKAQVAQPHQHLVFYLGVKTLKNGTTCRRPSMKPTYEDIRIAPQSELAQKLIADTLETTLRYGNSDSTERGEEVEVEVNPNSEDPNETNHAPPNTVPTLMTNVKEGPAHDVGVYAESIRKHQANIATTLKSEKKRVLEDIYHNFGSHQVSRPKLSSYPPWILDEAFNKEYETNWADAFIPVHERNVPKNANIIISHTVYKIKTDEDGERLLKNGMLVAKLLYCTPYYVNAGDKLRYICLMISWYTAARF